MQKSAHTQLYSIRAGRSFKFKLLSIENGKTQRIAQGKISMVFKGIKIVSARMIFAMGKICVLSQTKWVENVAVLWIRRSCLLQKIPKC